MDSLQNRKDYEKIFNYKKPGLELTDGSVGGGVGFDLDEIINVFRFKRNRRLLAFQERLIDDEQDKFIDHRFTRYIVKKITDLDGDAEDSFMCRYRPSYQFTQLATDYEYARIHKTRIYRLSKVFGLSLSAWKERGRFYS